MKKIIYLLLLFSAFANAQIGINNPTPYTVCEETLNSNVALFYLPSKNIEIFGSLNPDDYTVEYYSDSSLTTPISSPFSSSGTTIYIKVIDITNPTIYQITSLDLVVGEIPDVVIVVTQPTCNGQSSVFFSNLPSGDWYLKINGSNDLYAFNGTTHTISNLVPGIYTYQIKSISGCYSSNFNVTISAPVGVPVLNQSTELHNYEYPFDGVMSFDLTSHQNSIIGTQSGIDLFYYTSSADAQNNTNPIANPSSYQNTTNPQTIWVRAVNTNTNCFQLTDFKIKAFDSSTIVNIPDTNFKARLLSANYSNQIAFIDNGSFGSGYGKIDMNADGEIQHTEAFSVRTLNVQSEFLTNHKISDLTGIASFTEMYDLNCSHNLLTTINVIPLINNFNSRLNCSYNNLQNFNYNSLGSNLKELDCSGNNLTTLNINNLLNLKSLSCSYNQLTVLDIAPFHLEKLNCRNNQIATLNFSFPQEMIDLDISDNLITSLNLLPFSSNLMYFQCKGNSIPELNFSNVNLWRLFCGPVNTLTNLNNMNELRMFVLFGCQQTGNLSLSNSPFLQDVTIWNTAFSSLDLSDRSYLDDLNINNNLNLEYINLKTGKTWSGNLNSFYPISISNCPNLNFVCTDDSNVSNISQVLDLNSNNNPNVNVNSYCSFTPGGNYNTITGAIIYDANANGCEVTDVPQPNIKIDINDGANQGSTFTNNSGNYKFYTDAGSFNVTPNMENTAWFSVSPLTATIPFVNDNNNVVTQNFCITPNGVHPDLEIVIAPIVPARPGFDAVYKIVYKNKGNQTLSGSVNFQYNDANLDFVSSTTIPNSQATGNLVWNYANLLPFESRSVTVTLNVNSPTETPAVNINDVLLFTATVTPTMADETVSDNVFQYNQTVVGAYDPNNIICMEGNVVPPSLIGEYLHYVINFENTGNYEADNIVVKTEIDPLQFDVNSLRLLNTSHNAYVRINNNIVEFVFQNITLASGGHGNILLKIKSKNNLTNGAIVNKRADIFFDYNAPIDTGFENTIFQALSNSSVIKDNTISIYPNPTNSVITIKCDSTIKSIELFDVQGRVLLTKMISENSEVLDISDKANGIYFLKITSDKGIKVEKLIKE